MLGRCRKGSRGNPRWEGACPLLPGSARTLPLRAVRLTKYAQEPEQHDGNREADGTPGPAGRADMTHATLFHTFTRLYTRAASTCHERCNRGPWKWLRCLKQGRCPDDASGAVPQLCGRCAVCRLLLCNCRPGMGYVKLAKPGGFDARC